jgi:hypothetical protein
LTRDSSRRQIEDCGGSLLTELDKSDLVEAISLGEILSVEVPNEKVDINEYSKNFYPSMKHLLPGLKKK